MNESRGQVRRIQLNANQARRSRYSLDLPILEDANSIQVALMQGMRLLLTNQVDHRTAALLFYALQTASSNLSRTTFEPRPQQVVIDPSSIPDTSLGDDAWYKEEFTNDNDEDDQESAETNDELSEDTPKTINIHAMADCDRVAPGRRPDLVGDRVKPDLRPGLVGVSERLKPSSTGRNKATFLSRFVSGYRFSDTKTACFQRPLQGLSRPVMPRSRSIGFALSGNHETAYKMMSYEQKAWGGNYLGADGSAGLLCAGGSAGG